MSLIALHHTAHGYKRAQATVVEYSTQGNKFISQLDLLLMEYGYFLNNQIHKLKKPLTASCSVVGMINSVHLAHSLTWRLQVTKVMKKGNLED